MQLKNRVALVTGSGRGIGRACALRLAKLGADVVINDKNLKSAEESQEELTGETVMDEVKALGRRSLGIEADITKKQAVNSMFEQIVSEFGHLDILVNNAGGSQSRTGPLVGGTPDITEEDFRFILDVNLMGAIFCCQATAPLMIKQKWGRIVNVSSLQGLMVRAMDDLSFATRCAYGPAKSGIVQLTRILAAELGPHGILVNCVAPSIVLSSRILKFNREGRTIMSQERMKECPLGRPAVPEDIAKVVEFLCTDLSDYVTGQCIRVDGGRTLF